LPDGLQGCDEFGGISITQGVPRVKNNDPQADAYALGGHGSENGVVITAAC
jgi:hypothetical protein